MSNTADSFAPCFSMAELLVHAMVIELEAVQSYKDLNAQMQQCGNLEVARLFEKMSLLEAEHAAKIIEMAGDIELPQLAPWEYRWEGLESPENIDLDGVHYLMTAHHALKLALENEISAMEFFQAAANGCTDKRVRSMAIEFASDERQHVAWMRELLAKYPAADAAWDYDPDPPSAID